MARDGGLRSDFGGLELVEEVIYLHDELRAEAEYSWEYARANRQRDNRVAVSANLHPHLRVPAHPTESLVNKCPAGLAQGSSRKSNTELGRTSLTPSLENFSIVVYRMW